MTRSMTGATLGAIATTGAATSADGTGGGGSDPGITGGFTEAAAVSGAPHAAQNRLPGGFEVEQRAHRSSWVGAWALGPKSKFGAGGRDRPDGVPRSDGVPSSTPTGAVMASAGFASAGIPRGGVGSTTGWPPLIRFPQSWQNLRWSGLTRPHRSHLTTRKGSLHARPSQGVASPAGQGVT